MGMGIILPMSWLALILGSVAGGVMRYVVAGAIHLWGGSAWPYGTFVVNISGCFLIGWFTSFGESRGWTDPAAKLFLVTGFCGAYTTFSTLIFETAELLKSGQGSWGIVNVVASVAVGFACFLAGDRLGRPW